jgi:thiamine pyrophosphate-dependent acetolactate synthase large subunit-like protein
VTEKGRLDEALQQGFAHDGPALIEIMTDTELI